MTGVDLSALADTAWPALERLDIGGWQARFAGGVTKRANSAWRADAGAAPLEAALIARVEEEYRGRGLAPTFQLAAADAAGLPLLIGRGYRVVDETLVLAASVSPGRAGDADQDVELAVDPSAEWLAAWWTVDGRGGGAELDIARRILTATPALYAAVRVDGAVAAVARLALVGRWGGVYCVATVPEQRRRGLSRRALGALLAAGAERGVTDTWLQVLAANRPARTMYAALGFRPVDRYRYLVGATRPRPATYCR